MSKFSQLLKIIGGLSISYVIVIFFGPKLFINNTPTINKAYIASIREWPNSLRELPSKTSVLVASLFRFSDSSKTAEEQQRQIEKFKQDTGAVEVAFSQTEQQQAIAAIVKTENPIPNAVFNYLSKGVAAAPSENGGVVLRFDPTTGKNVRQFTLKDGRVIQIMTGE